MTSTREQLSRVSDLAPTAPGRPSWRPRTLGLPGGRRVRVEPRAVWVTLGALVGAAVITLVTLGSGALPVPPGAVLAALVGSGSPEHDFALTVLGFPRAAVAITAGAALGASGALIQGLTRNPLGSPDVIGFNAGAASGAVVGMIWLRLQPTQVTLLAVATGLAAAGLVCGLALRNGSFDGGDRLIIIGIGVGAALLAVNGYLLTRSRVQDSMRATRWLTGSLNDVDLRGAAMVALALAICLPIAAWLQDAGRISQLGDDSAAALGLRLRPHSIVTVVVAVVLSAVAVAAAGPISFIALAAPQVARRLAGTRGTGVFSAAATGALLLTLSDLVAQRAFGAHDLPVGVVTGLVGGAYLAWLLTRQWKKSFS